MQNYKKKLQTAMQNSKTFCIFAAKNFKFI